MMPRHDLPKKIEPYNKNKYPTPSRRVLFLNLRRSIPVKDIETASDDNNGCAILRWCCRRKAINQLKRDQIRGERRERENEYARQLSEIEEKRRNLAKDSLKTHCPYERGKTPRYSSEPVIIPQYYPEPEPETTDTYTFDEVYICDDKKGGKWSAVKGLWIASTSRVATASVCFQYSSLSELQ
ncbi:hypothetical protein O0L34_g5535 [Tuta absoluta]|nr:hypothetical protein O0L34_g5535 [Tuta absoluta]